MGLTRQLVLFMFFDPTELEVRIGEVLADATLRPNKATSDGVEYAVEVLCRQFSHQP